MTSIRRYLNGSVRFGKSRAYRKGAQGRDLFLIQTQQRPLLSRRRPEPGDDCRSGLPPQMSDFADLFSPPGNGHFLFNRCALIAFPHCFFIISSRD